MTADPGDPGEPQTLQDPLAEAMRVVDLADERGLLVRLMGGMAIRAHAPDWPARTRRVEVDLDFATRSKDRGAFYHLLEAEGYTPTSATTRCSAASRPTSWTCRAAVRSTSSSTASRCATASSSATGSAASTPTLPLAELLLSKLQIVKINRKDVLDALVLLAEHPLAQDDGAPDARTGLGRHQRAAHPVVHLERLGLVADGDRQPRHARPVPRRRADARGPRPQQRPGGPVRPGGPDRRPARRPSTTHRSRPAGSSDRGSASARPGTRIPKRWATTDARSSSPPTSTAPRSAGASSSTPASSTRRTS